MRIFVKIWLLVGSLSCVGQGFDFERIPNELGLSQNLISAICQDSQGFLWVGTKSGLNRFDGYRFKVFQHDPFDSTSISDDNITSIIEGPYGRLWIGTEHGLNIMDREKEIFIQFPLAQRISTANYDERKPQSRLKASRIGALLKDKSGNVWVGLRNGNLVKITLTDPSDLIARSLLTTFTASQTANSLWGNPIKSILEDAKGTIWVHSQHKICQLTKNDSSYAITRLEVADISPPWQDLPPSKEQQIFFSMFKDKEESVWVIMSGGFAKWNPIQHAFSFYPILPVDMNARAIPPLHGCEGVDGWIDQKGRIWVNGMQGLTIYDTLSHRVVAQYHSALDDSPDMFKSGVRSMFVDQSGSIWLGTNGKGLYRYAPHKKLFSGSTEAMKWSGESIRAICQSSDSAIWLGTASRKLLRLDAQTGQAQAIPLIRKREPYTPDEALDQVFAMIEDRTKNVWIAASKGLFRIPISAKQPAEIAFFPIYPEEVTYPHVLDIHIDSEDRIWLLTYAEFGQFDPATGRLNGHDYLAAVAGKKKRGNNFPCIFQQENGMFWLGLKEGLLHFNPDKNQFKLYANEPSDPQSLSHPVVKSIIADPQNPNRILWIGTGGGLNRFDIQAQSCTHFTTKDGLPDKVIYAILDDEKGNLWLSTNQGISKFNPTQEIFKNYNTTHGLQDNEFNSAAYFKAADGRLFLGGINGFNAFHPTVIKDHNFAPEIFITDFKLANKSVDFKLRALLDKPISQTEELILAWHENIFSFELAALDFTEPSQNQYAYWLENFNTDWQYMGTQRTVTFTNLDPGDYILHIKASNYDGVWNEEDRQLKITILPPWWASMWAYLAYAVLIITLIYSIYRFQLKRSLAMAEAQRLKELDAFKTQLYTNITHEFRTPLTTILGMAQQIKKQPHIAAELIHRNGKHLLRLVNEMLDLSKLESGKMELEMETLDVIPYLRYVTESFQSLAATRDIQLQIYIEVDALYLEIDKEKLKQIVSNLLSNAIKYTPQQGRVSLAITRKLLGKERAVLQLSIKDTGRGISPENLPYIFDRFFRVDNDANHSEMGTGIGLAITQEFVKLMGGRILAKSELGKGSEFIVELPIGKPSSSMPISPSLPAQEADIAAQTALAVPPSTPKQDKPMLLLVEDNLDVVAYLKIFLQDTYDLHVTHEGASGIAKAQALIPDIIISDVMMPKKNGFELTDTLKNDPRTSHIPIILLTAKATDKDRITGLSMGADAYLLKPFNQEELEVRLEKMLELRKSLQTFYATKLTAFSQDHAIPSKASLDEQFLQKMSQIVEERIDDAELDINYLCQAMHLSASQLNRKMKALTAMPPMRFVRKIRLHKAKVMLKNSDDSIAEIAYQVGFSDPNYFSRAFSKEFGESPKR